MFTVSQVPPFVKVHATMLTSHVALLYFYRNGNALWYHNQFHSRQVISGQFSIVLTCLICFITAYS